VQAAVFAMVSGPGAHPQVVGVPKHDARARLRHLLGGQRFDAPLRSTA